MGEIKSLGWVKKPIDTKATATSGWVNKPIDTRATSIESQVAAYIITDLQTKDKEVSDDLIQARNAWLRYALKHFVKVEKI